MLDGATIDDTGLMSNGTLKYNADTFTKDDQRGKSLTFALDYLRDHSEDPPEGWEVLPKDEYTWTYNGNGNEPDQTYNSQTLAIQAAWDAYLLGLSKDEKIQLITSKGWKDDSTLVNTDENSILGLSLESEGNPVGATKAIDLTNKNFSLGNVQFYNSTTGDVIEDESSATPLSCKPGVYDVMGILTKKGDKTIISGPVAKSSDES